MFVIIFIFFVIVIIIVYKLLHSNVNNKKKRSEDYFEKPVKKSSNIYRVKEDIEEKNPLKCRYCGEEIAEEVQMCPFCGSYLSK
jgi:hypothetical protein